MSVLQAVEIHHTFGTTEVLKGVSLQLNPGEVVALTGPSGSGKSTLLHLLAGLERPTQGQVMWGGSQVSTLRGAPLDRLRNQHIGLVFQQHYLLSDLTVLHNALVPSWIQARHDQEEALELLARVGLAHRLQHYPSQLSGGERQRVALVRAVLNRPSVILADEPTGNLDQHNTQEVMRLLLELARERGSGVLLVTHDQPLAEKADRILRLLDGALVS
ncbi:ABC transporter ATP-binding protein [Deinococcus cellulosilyticus]|uniref:ABC transporter ATP-binding protein n=1 Tax=Deinococcus cellulosilyticus (strain DSM 18568 / NBRC 106333 / KACC 11606 / 5516J-15) TaxID=1223518 RepID=A0A511MWY8_DEIC1|nr:ABC transporter ATP-binding protein [Deinococcus cellulosilyticus]GEM45080.1 ABC transporter ATP-binding protein [Deinococcus cellulosilyticus NBRC 106333 = KACC 11606]